MQLITDKYIESLGITKGMEALQGDVDLLEQFVTHANGCGLENLDSVSGRLIEQGLESRYPSHFTAGAGLEGLGELIGKLKQGISGLKKALRAKDKPMISKYTAEIRTAVEKTYANAKWVDGKIEINKPISASALGALVGNVTSYADIATRINEVIKQYDANLKRLGRETTGYYAKAKPFLKKGQNVEGAAAKSVLEELLAAVPKTPEEAIDWSIPKFEGKGETIPALSKAEVVGLGKLILTVFAASTKISMDIDDITTGCDEDALEGINDQALSKALWVRCFWEDVSMPAWDCAENMEKRLVQIAQALEGMINNAVK